MTKEEILGICQKEMCNRLKKYDVVGTNIDAEKVEREITQCKNALKKEFVEHLKNAKHVKELRYIRRTECIEKKYKDKKYFRWMHERKNLFTVHKLLDKIFSENDIVKWELFYELSGECPTQKYISESIPKVIKLEYIKLKSSLQKYKCTALWLYERDLFSAVAFHECVSNLKLQEREIGEIPFFNFNNYLNIPVELKVKINQQSYFIYPEMVKILNKKYFDGTYKNMFRNW